ncbi:hypothetical protein ACS5UA_01740 [Brucella sp. RRSP16]|uniref:Flp pilus-assembly TadG-like N-terminal domain-containing protein n=2 Tax=Brucella intermedia TaxID=94625 RepID=A0ABR6AJ68_9HYPH|nr:MULTISPECIES: hypothetical protein [Brucella]ERI14353.1 hypothetical protein O206_22490 [Ochrobactrum sp. EGD-AQ16]KAB2696899.1 hypothetical protein F9K72_01765 [Brucella intermedia]KAB2708351.1 hypothetical protein F9K80_14765 [Brucella intermedia]MBA8849437.1 hypothetical protein [Brucella intermedia]MCH6204851.1 hypothetical protein [Brucella ciceri]
MKGITNTEQHKRHGFMLFVTCVLSFTAFLFAVDFSSIDEDAARSHAGGIVARQVEGSPATPVRQQSTPSPQPMRAILIEAIAAKIKTAYLDGTGAALLVASAGVILPETKSAEAAQNFPRLAVLQRHFGSARAPPKSA